MTWLSFLAQEDDELLAQCDFDAFRGSGPGGQKRNKTSSAVRLVHRPTGLTARAETSRSQSVNRKAALKRLRMELALRCRARPVAFDLAKARPGDAGDVARMLDVLEARDYRLSDAARDLCATTAGLAGFICANELLMTEVNRQRHARGLRTIRT